MTRLFLWPLAALVQLACVGTEPLLPMDAGRDASVPDDSGVIFVDGGPDAGLDAGPDSGFDGGLDGGQDGGGDGGGGPCVTSVLCPSCPPEASVCDAERPCGTGEVCLSTGCEAITRCFTIGGGACAGDGDCPDPNYACDLSIGRCLRTSPGCLTSVDCVPGYACEAGSCVDRRVPCLDHDDCPHGYSCRHVDDDQRFCRRITRPCELNTDCLALGVPCGDADGDGQNECMPSQNPDLGPDGGLAIDGGDVGEPCENTECSAGGAPVCEPQPQGTRAQCGQHGLCVDAGDCAAGFVCRDVWGDGRKECVLPSGSCTDTSDCAERQVCASPRAGGSLACHAGAGT